VRRSRVNAFGLSKKLQQVLLSAV